MGGYTLGEGGGRSQRDEPGHLGRLSAISVLLVGQFIGVARSMHASELWRLLFAGVWVAVLAPVVAVVVPVTGQMRRRVVSLFVSLLLIARHVL